MTDEQILDCVRDRVYERRNKKLIPDGILANDFYSFVHNKYGERYESVRDSLNSLVRKGKIGAYPTMHGKAIKLID